MAGDLTNRINFLKKKGVISKFGKVTLPSGQRVPLKSLSTQQIFGLSTQSGFSDMQVVDKEATRRARELDPDAPIRFKFVPEGTRQGSQEAVLVRSSQPVFKKVLAEPTQQTIETTRAVATPSAAEQQFRSVIFRDFGPSPTFVPERAGPINIKDQRQIGFREELDRQARSRIRRPLAPQESQREVTDIIFPSIPISRPDITRTPELTESSIPPEVLPRLDSTENIKVRRRLVESRLPTIEEKRDRPARTFVSADPTVLERVEPSRSRTETLFVGQPLVGRQVEGDNITRRILTAESTVPAREVGKRVTDIDTGIGRVPVTPQKELSESFVVGQTLQDREVRGDAIQVTRLSRESRIPSDAFLGEIKLDPQRGRLRQELFKEAVFQGPPEQIPITDPIQEFVSERITAPIFRPIGKRLRQMQQGKRGLSSLLIGGAAGATEAIAERPLEVALIEGATFAVGFGTGKVIKGAGLAFKSPAFQKFLSRGGKDAVKLIRFGRTDFVSRAASVGLFGGILGSTAISFAFKTPEEREQLVSNTLLFAPASIAGFAAAQKIPLFTKLTIQEKATRETFRKFFFGKKPSLEESLTGFKIGKPFRATPDTTTTFVDFQLTDVFQPLKGKGFTAGFRRVGTLASPVKITKVKSGQLTLLGSTLDPRARQLARIARKEQLRRAGIVEIGFGITGRTQPGSERLLRQRRLPGLFDFRVRQTLIDNKINVPKELIQIKVIDGKIQQNIFRQATISFREPQLKLAERFAFSKRFLSISRFKEKAFEKQSTLLKFGFNEKIKIRFTGGLQPKPKIPRLTGRKSPLLLQGRSGDLADAISRIGTKTSAKKPKIKNKFF